VEEVEEDVPTEGWVLVKVSEDMAGPLFIIAPEFDSTTSNRLHCISSTTNGTVHLKPIPSSEISEAEPTQVDQVFVCHPLALTESSEQTVYTLRTPDGNYLSCDQYGLVSAPTAALGPQEQWEVIVKEDGIAFENVAHGKYLTVDPEMGELRGDGDTIGFMQVFRVKCQAAIRAKRFKKASRVAEKTDAELELENA
jgi:protein FRG1